MKIFKIIESALTKALFALVMSLCCQTSFAETEKYLINPGDVLEISVWNEDALKREVKVLPDGSIGFPLAGTVSAAGRTVDDLKKELTGKLTEYIAEPVVNIAIKSAEGNAVYVTGQVKAPGKFLMTEQMNVMQVLSLAGGLTPFAKGDDIVILRKTSKGAESIKFEYSDLEEGYGLSKNHLLKSGDVIVVP
ncbi:polysaccharide biosynthesis/export family protein [Methyloglobulus sp.]|uniref:polysaccharide biosynthesis/export family protein n=1 Tax=Methyloglobulus sp. TaxID=2518622 RepID=UPI0032B817AB